MKQESNTFIENQNVTWIVILCWLFIFSLVFFLHDETEVWPLMIVLVVTFIASLLFYRLKTEVTDQYIKLTFGLFLRKSIDLRKIKKVSSVRNSWFHGWGIRFTLSGWMWNIYGLSAVELEFRDRDRTFKIGSKDPDRLKEEIDKRLSN